MVRVSFADPIREALLALDPWVNANGWWRLSELVGTFGWDYTKREYTEVRTLLQRMGTEAGRNIHGFDCWVDIACDRICKANGSVIVTDLRFENELKMVRDLDGVVVHVTRPGVGKVNNHISEQMDYAKVSTLSISNDGDIHDLRRSVEVVLALTKEEQ